jgi:hypothetical protein
LETKIVFNDSILTDPVACQAHCFFVNDDSFLNEETLNCFDSTLLESKYEAINIHQVAKQQLQLDKQKQNDLTDVLSHYQKLFKMASWVALKGQKYILS